ncbi:uncharacterized protein LOC131050574 isoform X2 [Cryptomeria japonica]|uniref:uncharacterized protein LOC131050574 isoform X2 n=1 Tax=Cryptomeria japonica TaxID=3369 RepID=UPI0027DA3F34|nr:uncharacterized protein LOC131050574 isoform X2 [Cryptomeria japonica]
MERDNNKWGTWEELLLGSAVKRHGTNNWDSVAMEVQARKLSPFAFSSQDCKAKYHVLQGRFNNSCSNGMPLLEELRKLRVSHLKRELQRYDDSIVSLESKLKRLKAEREQGRVKQEEDLRLGKADLQSGLHEKQDPPQLGVVPCVEASLPTPTSIPLKSGVEGCAPASPLDSYYGSSETTAKDQSHRTKEDLPESTDVQSQRLTRPSGGFQEGSAESREIGEDQLEEEAGKGISESGVNRKEGQLDSSDVLSSAEYSTRRRREGDGDGEGDGEGDGSSHADEDEDEGEDVEGREKDSVGGCQWNHQQQQQHQKCSGESQGAETDEMSSMSQRSRREAKVPGKLLPLLECLRTISAHKFGPIFKHRLQSQGEVYRSMIRRHMDLAMVRSKLEEGSYSGSLEFFRDVLLVFNNALVYYPKSSQEFGAAYVLRELATKEMVNIFQTEALLKQEGPSTRKREPRKGPELKPIIVCRKRSASGESHVDRPKSTQQSSTSALAATQMQQSDSGKQVEMKDAEVNEIKAAKGKVEEGSKIPAQSPLNNTPDSQSQQKTPDTMLAGSNSIKRNANQQSKSQLLTVGTNKSVMDTHNPDRPIKKNTKKTFNTDSRRDSSSSIHDLGEFVASNKISESAIRPKKSGGIKIEPSKTSSPIMETKNISSNHRQDRKKDQELNMPNKQSVTANATSHVHSPLKRGVGRPPKHAQQKQHQQQQEAEESELLVSKPRKKARR